MRLLRAFFRHREEWRLRIGDAALQPAPLHGAAVDVSAERAVAEAHANGVTGVRRGNTRHHRRFTLDDRVPALQRGERIERAQAPDAAAYSLDDLALTALNRQQAPPHHVIEPLANWIDARGR